ncbi:Glucoamylase (glucan-1,4-alpha-glucosidase), GH15 family [Clostridium cavendishii DSM 21758]|uniref:Glucoamylase (Glucan-1,4-alpha-glucosidase), GH15 family n=1 Tax=Clostridium cavendishii DSM 21758 TaxID=1121302 RepID=A0A1M6HVL6_9CLOT|nr:CBM35 domain-containing protein [Clostridium cavendishii]SHJ26137.1 Glucoamylase (glucan-1,4-alpha-glucosidase), GH15 family [Clostridium cavendishii DSM 21758]
MRNETKRNLSKMLVFLVTFSSGLVTKNTFASAQVYNESCYEAEAATKNNVQVNNNHKGYTGEGFIDSYGKKGDYVQFDINIPKDTGYTLRLRYANGNDKIAEREVYCDGKFISKAYFKGLGNWENWGSTDVGTNLSAGKHSIKVAVDNSNDGDINLDNLIVVEKNVSVTSLYASNWNDMMAIWKSSKLSDNDNSSTKGPRIDELRYAGDWGTNQIQDYSSFFRDETNGVKYNEPHNFSSEGYYDENGILHNNLLKYGEKYIPNVEISKDYAMVPKQNFIVTKYTLKNKTDKSIKYNILDMLHSGNKSNKEIKAEYSQEKNAIIIDRSNSGQPALILGAFTKADSYQCANDSELNSSKKDVSPWSSFNESGSLKNNNSVSAQNVSAAFEQNVDIAPNASEEIYFYMGLAKDTNEINNVCNTAKAKTGKAWFEHTSNLYNEWFKGKKIPKLKDADLTTVYKRNLIMIKNCTKPGNSSNDGAMPATTNPLAYGYKVWARDSAVTAMSLDAAGFNDEAGKYWRWLAARQSDDGSFHTCFDLWNNNNANFVEPEYDSLGMFLIGAQKHYELTKDKEFLNAIYPAVKKTSDFIMYRINNTNGFGPADKSIWEEGDYPEYYSYTQAAYAMGLKSAALMATEKKENTVADSYNGAASTILTAINRDDTDVAKGLWNVKEGYYNRCINGDNTVNNVEDSSTNVLFALGAIDVNSSRATSHIKKLEKDLMVDEYGLPRYKNDNFYYTSQYSPSGNEALESSPSWPQMTMWDSIYQSYTGKKDKAYEMLKWFKTRTAVGYMVTGESVSNITEAPLVSTAAEPVTAAAYVLASLAYDGYDMRTYASENNSGTFKQINVTKGASADWKQYNNVPYYVDKLGDTQSKDNKVDISKVYICNDDKNVYVRINNAAGKLNGFNSDTVFESTVYCENFNRKTPTTQSSKYGTALDRDMAYMFSRKSNEDSFNKYTVKNNAWTLDKNITDTIAPQWDPNTGGVEIVIPRSEIGNPANGEWGHFTVVLSELKSGKWSDQDTLKLNYRLTGEKDSWIYGNFE